MHTRNINQINKIHLLSDTRGESYMIAIVCIDDNGGMMFNSRRLSRDKLLTEKIVDISKESKLWICAYSHPLFKEMNADNINISEKFILEASEGEFCFIENAELKPHEKLIEKLILFKWNRVYPKDFIFDIDISDWKLLESTDFVGNSHSKITMKVYTK